MKKTLFTLVVVACVLAVGLPSAQAVPSELPPGLTRKIVVLKPGTDLAEGEALVSAKGAFKVKTVESLNGVVVLSSGPRVDRALEADPRVDRVIVDQVYHADARPAARVPGQSLPWGVDRIDADLAWGITTGDAVRVAVIDTGIDTLHPDLLANIAGGASMVGYTTSYQDDNGHGTHVAGTVAAADNTIGVVGVAPDVDILSVKVLDSSGSGYLSDVIAGIDWAIANGADVINMSFGASSYVPELYYALCRADQAGVVQVAAASNTGGAVTFPAVHNEVIAVSAVDKHGRIAYFSSRGDAIDLAAPGVDIKSTYPGGYALMSGTSMASPHVAGVAALVLTRPIGAYDTDADGIWDPVEVKAKLQDTAEERGALGYDTLYGYGLVDAERAVR